MANLIVTLKDKFGSDIIDTLNDILIHAEIKGTIYLPFSPFGSGDSEEDFYIYIDDLDASLKLENLDQMLLEYFGADEFDHDVRIIAAVNGNNLQNIKFYYGTALKDLKSALEYKDTCGINHTILSAATQEQFVIKDEEIVLHKK